MLFKKDFEKLRSISYDFIKKDESHLISFMKGYLLSKNDKEFINYISMYLHQEYQINIDYTTWIEQVDHYAFSLGKSWYDAFFDLMFELQERQPVLVQENKYEKNESSPKESKRNLHKQTTLQNGITLKVGDYIKLSDKIGEDYKQTKFYNASLRNPSWDLFYPSEKDFKYLHFYFGEDEASTVTILSPVRRIFSDSIVCVESISSEQKRMFAYSNLFRIDIEEAIINEEIEVIGKSNKEINSLELAFFAEKIGYHLMGISEYTTFDELLSRWCIYNFHYLQKKWYNYNRSINNGEWYKVSK